MGEASNDEDGMIHHMRKATEMYEFDRKKWAGVGTRTWKSVPPNYGVRPLTRKAKEVAFSLLLWIDLSSGRVPVSSDLRCFGFFDAPNSGSARKSEEVDDHPFASLGCQDPLLRRSKGL
jgi:hypothetical protein